MPRPIKTGLSYFPKDVDFYNDYKIMDLLEMHGPAGVIIYDVILCEIYRSGYYLAAPMDRVASNIVRIIGSKWVQKRLVLQVILDCGDIGLFETTLLQHGVITSVGIQRRYATVTLRNKANKEKYWLIDENGQPLLNEPNFSVSATETHENVAETNINVADIPQKESKQNKTKQKISAVLQSSPCENVIYKLNLLDGSDYPITQDMIETYKDSYPAVDLDKEFRKMIAWIYSNPKNRKTEKGILRFVNGWLTRAQDSARPDRTPAVKQNQFHNFQQRDTDYDALITGQLQEERGE